MQIYCFKTGHTNKTTMFIYKLGKGTKVYFNWLEVNPFPNRVTQG